ncbi:MAG TPA: wax ester/triacylglycerol synthase family O-acyltransferase [Rudaea sp.]|nr:wax ester/triacylglycerol synthase family O-acyltransferase [Rudaea sp.]
MAKPASVIREPMSKVDTAWLRMESPTNLMMITGLMVFGRRMSRTKLKRVIAERFLAYPRFRQKAVDSGTAATWETDADFDLDWHVRLAALSGKAGKPELEAFVSELASTPLDHTHPLWQFHLIEKYDGGSSVVARIHHCYADGLALVQVMLSLTDAASKPTRRAPLAKAWLKRDQGGVVSRLLAPTRAGLGKALALGELALEKGAEFLRHPALAAAMAREGSEIARELAIALNLSDDPPTRFKKGALGARKRCAWADPLPLADAKAVSRILRCTVNDLLLACAAGALRSYLLAIGEKVDGITIRATVPVTLRPLEHAKKLGNHFGLVFLDLPVGEANPLRRLECVAASMRALKRSKQAALTFGLLAAVGMAPVALQRMALELFSRKATTVATNVPGPQMPLYLAGCEVKELMFWVPQNGSVGMGLSILSYNGRVHFGLIADGKRVPDPEPIVQRFVREFEKLALITMMEDWSDDIAAGDAAATLERFARV